MLDDLARVTGSIIGTVVGSVAGVASSVIAATLGITASMVDEAIKAGCSTYEEIKDFHKL